VDCQENGKVAAVKFEMLEDNRRSLIRRCLDTRQYVARLAAQQSGVCDRDIRWVFQRVARDVDAPTAEMHQGVQDIDRGVLDMPAWILCLEHLGHLDNRGSAAALAADGGDLRDGRHRGARGLYTLQEAQDQGCTYPFGIPPRETRAAPTLSEYLHGIFPGVQVTRPGLHLPWSRHLHTWKDTVANKKA
jgi:hypothetical protein